MRILRLRIEALGPLRRFDTGPDPLPGFVVLSGPNEAGKSSLLAGIRAALHGFYPASRARHPLAPWEGEDAEILAWLTSDDGTPYRVHRRLLSTPWGRLLTGEGAALARADADDPRRVPEGAREADLRNQEVPPASHVPVEVYQEVHAVTLPQLASLAETGAWQEVRHRILAGMATREMASPAALVRTLEDRAGALWRPDRKRRTRWRELEEARQGAHVRLRKAREADRELREARDALARAEARLTDLREARARSERHLETLQGLLPARTRLLRLETLAARVGDASKLEGLSRDPLGGVEEALARLEKAEGEAVVAQEGVEEARRTAVEPHPDDGAWEAAAPTLQQLRETLLRAEEARDRLRDEARDVAALEDEIRGLTQGLLTEGADALEGAEALGRLDLEHLRELLDSRLRARERETEATVRREAAGLDEAAPPRKERPATTVPVLFGMAGLLVLAAVAVLAWGQGGPLPAVLALVVAGVLGGVAWSVHRSEEGRQREQEVAAERRREERSRWEADVQTAGAHRRAAEAAVESALGGIPLAPELRATAGPSVLLSLQRLRERVFLLATRRRTLEEGRSELAMLLERVSAWEPPGTGGDGASGHEEGTVPGEGAPPPEEALHGARARLVAWEERARRGAERTREAAGSRLRMEGATAELERATKRVEEARAGVRVLAAALARAGETPLAPGGPSSDPPPPDALREGARRVGERLDALRLLREGRTELESVFGSLDALRARLAEAFPAGGESPPDLAPLQAEVQERREAVEAVVEERERARAALLQAETVETPDALESELASLEEEQTGVRRERDRLHLLARIVGVAERRFRERHQPELLLRAESTLARLTGGRWTRLELLAPGEEGDGRAGGGGREDPGIRVRGPASPEGRAVDLPLSTGTLEQIWFSLRLAMIPVAESGGEPLPVVLDETLVNWDAERREAGLRALGEVARTRQVFLLTCHPWLGEEGAQAGARHLRIDPAP